MVFLRMVVVRQVLNDSLPDLGKLSEEEVRLLSAFRQSDIEARAAILEQAEFQLGRADRRRERK
jgi:hypothetical protein